MKETISNRSPSLQNLTNDVSSLSVAKPVVDRRFRLVMLGASKVGKTALVERFLGRSCPVRHRATVEELHELEVVVHGIKVTLEILDTSGTYEFPAMRRLAYDKGDAFLLVYAVDNADSFEAVRSIRQELRERRGKDGPALVVANKSDLIPALSSTVAETVVRLDWEYPFVQCSAMKDQVVTSAFSELLVDLVRIEDAVQNQDNPQESIRKKHQRGISLPQATIQQVRPKQKVPLIKRHSCVIS